jgi:DNA-directed RNA polymerase II subunit RPB2
VVDELGEFTVRPNAQHVPGAEPPPGEKEVTVRFGQIYLSKPTVTEADGETAILFPKDARLRGLTYAAPLYGDVTMRTRVLGAAAPDDAAVAAAADPAAPPPPSVLEDEVEEYPKVFIGEVPIMLRSAYCSLADAADADLAALGECPFDQGGYFVVNGSEKVLVAQERLANNACYVFKKPSPKYAWAAETRSAPEGAVRALSSVAVRMLARGAGGAGAPLRVALPYVKADVPLVVAFRALGLTSDRDVIEHIVFDGGDADMLEALRPSIEEAFPIQSQETALDFIGKRAGAAASARGAHRVCAGRAAAGAAAARGVGAGGGHEEGVLFG